MTDMSEKYDSSDFDGNTIFVQTDDNFNEYV